MTNDANASKPIASAETIRTFRVMALTGYIGLLLFMVLWQLFYMCYDGLRMLDASTRGTGGV